MMIRSYIKKILVLMFLPLSVLFNSCTNEPFNEKEIIADVRDLEQIRESGKLMVVTESNSVNYYIYEGQPMGFQYEILQELSDYLGLMIEVKVNNDHQQNFESLIKGDYDLIASNLTVTSAREKIADFTVPHSQARQILVQKTSQKKAISHLDLQGPVTNPLELGGRTVYIPKASAFKHRLQSLSDEIGESIKIIEVPLSSEQLIKLVAKGEIDFTVADENIAVVNKKYHPELDIETAISFPQNLTWAVRKGTVDLKHEIDTWLESFTKTKKYGFLYHKYFRSPQSVRIVNSKFYYPETGKISYYDDILKRESQKIGWDWRLLASLVYQESRFNPEAVSHAGAFGLMQLMPQTAIRFGVNEESSPVDQIQAGVKFIEWLDKRFITSVPDPTERQKFILASYNAGLGHVLDAMKLTEKYGGNPEIWEGHVEYYMMKKSDPLFYNDAIVKNGYLRGTETFNFVRKIMYRYNHYLNIEHVDLAQLFPQDQ